MIKDLRHHSQMRFLLLALLFFMFFFIVGDILVKSEQLGLSVNAVNTTLIGNEAEFIEPVTASTFLEHLHADLFFMMMLLLTLSSIFLRLAPQNSLSLWTLSLLMISSILSIIFLALGFYSSTMFVAPFLLMFFTWHALALSITLYSFWKLLV